MTRDRSPVSILLDHRAHRATGRGRPLVVADLTLGELAALREYAAEGVDLAFYAVDAATRAQLTGQVAA